MIRAKIRAHLNNLVKEACIAFGIVVSSILAGIALAVLALYVTAILMGVE